MFAAYEVNNLLRVGTSFEHVAGHEFRIAIGGVDVRSGDRCDCGARQFRLVVEERILPPHLQCDGNQGKQQRKFSLSKNGADQRDYRQQREPWHDRSHDRHERPSLNLFRQDMRHGAEKGGRRRYGRQKTANGFADMMVFRLVLLVQCANRFDRFGIRFCLGHAFLGFPQCFQSSDPNVRHVPPMTRPALSTNICSIPSFSVA